MVDLRVDTNDEVLPGIRERYYPPRRNDMFALAIVRNISST